MDELVRDLLELKVELLNMREHVDPGLRERIKKLCVAITAAIKDLEGSASPTQPRNRDESP